MKKAELFQMASSISREVVKRNQELINERVHDTFVRSEEDSTLSINEVVGRSIALMLNLAPEISAAITAAMLVELGLVTLEDEE